MNFGEILSKAWQIIWKHKVLWIFGILAGCASGGGSGNGVTYTFGSNDFNNNAWRPFNLYFDSFAQALPWLFLIFLITLIVVVLVIFLGTIGRIGLIRGTQVVDQGVQRLTFKEVFSSSTPYFWRVFALNLLIGFLIVLFIFMLLLIMVLGTVFTLGIGLLCFIPLLCLLVPLSWLVTIWVEQANIAIVVEDLGIIEGLNKGWDIFKKNLGTLLLMGLILLVINLVIGFLLAIPFFFVLAPVLMGLSFGANSDIWLGVWVSGICLVLFIPVFLVLYGILTAYTKSVWTLTYLRLTRRAGTMVPPVTFRSSEDISPETTGKTSDTIGTDKEKTQIENPDSDQEENPGEIPGIGELPPAE